MLLRLLPQTRAATTRAVRTSMPVACAARTAPATRFFTHAAAGGLMSSTSEGVAAGAAAASSSVATPLVAPAFGTNGDAARRFVYIKGVKNDGRSKRFYSQVDIQTVLTARGEEYGIQLDGRFIVTPYNQILSAPTQAAAAAIAFEWDSQGDFIRPVSMPLSNICVTALDQAFTDRDRFLTHFRSAMKTDSVLSDKQRSASSA